MTNPPSTASQRVRFEEITPTHEIVAYFSGELTDLVAGRGLPILSGYDDLDDIQFCFVTLPSGHTVVLAQYENAPETGVDLYVELNPQGHPNNIPDLAIETCKYLAIPRSIAIWFHPDYEEAIGKSYPSDGEINKIAERWKNEYIPVDNPSEPIECFYYALEIYPRERIPEYWAMLQHNLGLAYYHRIIGERWRKLQEAIACFNRSLEVFTEDEFPQKWQINQEDLNRSQAEWKIAKKNLIGDILDRPGGIYNLLGADLSEANLIGANLYKALLIKANLYGANLSEANLIGANLHKAELIRSNLHKANLSEAFLYGAKLSEANLYEANLSRADLSEAYLLGADLSESYLSKANLSGADLRGANLRGANVKKTRFGRNKGISASMREDLISRGAIFDDLLGDRSAVQIPVPC